MNAPAMCTAWGIKMPFAKVPYIFAFSVRRTRKACIEAFIYDIKYWKKYYRMGYRCVKVTVRADLE